MACFIAASLAKFTETGFIYGFFQKTQWWLAILWWLIHVLYYFRVSLNLPNSIFFLSLKPSK